MKLDAKLTIRVGLHVGPMGDRQRLAALPPVQRLVNVACACRLWESRRACKCQNARGSARRRPKADRSCHRWATDEGGWR